MYDPIIITFTDLKKVFFRHIFALRTMAVFSFFCMFVFLLIREPQFLAEVSVQRTAKITDYYAKLPEVYRAFSLYPIRDRCCFRNAFRSSAKACYRKFRIANGCQ